MPFGMKYTLRLLISLALLLKAAACSAEPHGLTSVTPDEIAQLETMHQQATDFLLKNDFQAALRVYSDIVLVEPDDETAYTGLGQIYMVLGQTKKAHDAFQNALQIDPNNEVAIMGIQKIMDPDGVEGMTGPREMQENPAVVPQGTLTVHTFIDPGHKAWQKSDGRWGPMRARKAGQPAGGTRVGKLHAQRVQMALRNAGIYQGAIDGMMGVNVQHALRNFQKQHGLENTGTVNIATWNALVSYLDVGPR